jgi:hypothetical protein
VWTWYNWTFGGAEIEWLGLRVRSHDWRRPALLAIACTALFVAVRGGIRVAPRLTGKTSWLAALGFGAALGTVVFFWIYWAAYREHVKFPEAYLLSHLAARDPSLWTNPLTLVRDLGAYDSRRSFALALVLAALSWIPWFNTDRAIRRYGLWLLVVSVVVLLVPLKLGSFSLWRSVFEPLPGFAVIRDPKRIIYLYELAAVLATAIVLARLPAGSAFRRSAGALVVLLLVIAPNRVTFGMGRPTQVFAKWVEAPLAIDASCRSFFIKPASAAYTSRSGYVSALYSIDAMFIALAHDMPTLNGFSAWGPGGWELSDPQAAGYRAGLKRWVERHGLRDVCELDIEARTMRDWDAKN